jgi:hypothetical protein
MSDQCCNNPNGCKKTLNEEQIQAQSLEAQSLGFSPELAADVLAKYGPQVLAVVIAGVKNGLSLSFTMECLKLFGPAILDFMTTLFTKSKEQVVAQSLDASPEDAVAQALAKGSVEALPPAVVNILLEKLLPWVLDKYGQQILQAILEAVLPNTKSTVKAE